MVKYFKSKLIYIFTEPEAEMSIKPESEISSLKWVCITLVSLGVKLAKLSRGSPHSQLIF